VGAGLGDDSTGVTIGQSVPMRLVDNPCPAFGGLGVGGQPAATVSADGTDRHGFAIDLELNPLTCADAAGGDGVEAGLEGDQAVFADPAQVLVGDQIRLLGQSQQRGPVGLGTDRDDLSIGALHLGPADQQPSLEPTIELSDRVELSARDDVIADDADLSFDAALARGPVGRQHIDAEPVVLGERRRFRVQRDRETGCDMAADHGLGAVIDDAARDTTEVREPPPVTVPERGQVHARGKTRERVPRVRQRHVERVHIPNSDVSQDVALVSPVDLDRTQFGGHGGS